MLYIYYKHTRTSKSLELLHCTEYQRTSPLRELSSLLLSGALQVIAPDVHRDLCKILFPI